MLMENDLEKPTLLQRIENTVGATSSILLIVLIASWLDLIPGGVALSMGLFISMPLIFSFIFGVIMNKPNFTSTLRHYGFGIYLVLITIIYFSYLKPDSFTLFGKYIIQFVIGFTLSIIGGLLYLGPAKLLKNKEYRWRASISFVTSFSVTIIIIIFLNKYLFNWIS